MYVVDTEHKISWLIQGCHETGTRCWRSVEDWARHYILGPGEKCEKCHDSGIYSGSYRVIA